jgi:26S proteasome regulatory subunit N1
LTSLKRCDCYAIQLFFLFLCINFRHLAGEIAGEWADMSGTDEELRLKLVGLAHQIVPYNMAHNAEAEACDLLMEIERLDLLEQYVDESAYPRVCLYLTR